MAEKKVVEVKEKKPVKKAKKPVEAAEKTVQEEKAPIIEVAAKSKSVQAQPARPQIKSQAKSKLESGAKVKLQQVASGAGHTNSQVATLKGLKLNKVGKVVELEDTSAIRGMIAKVKHLLRIFK